jgi:hypothetical protein
VNPKKAMRYIAIILVIPCIAFGISWKRSKHWGKAFKALAWTTTILGIFPIFYADCNLSDCLDPLIFNAKGNVRTDGIFSTLSPILFGIDMTLELAPVFLSPPLIVLGLAGLIFLYSRSTALPLFNARPYTITSFGSVMVALILISIFSVQFFFVPKGEPIRPMGWAVSVAFISICTFAVVELTSILAIILERPRYFGVIGILAGFVPDFFGTGILHFAAMIRGFVLEP